MDYGILARTLLGLPQGILSNVADPFTRLKGGVLGDLGGPTEGARVYQGGANSEAPSGNAPLAQMVVARRLPSGKIIYGTPGQIHADLYPGMVDNEIADKDLGFALQPGGKFLSREQALKYIQRLTPQANDLYDPEGRGKLDAYWLNK